MTLTRARALAFLGSTVHPGVLAELDAEMELCGEMHGPFTTTLGERWFDLVVKRHERSD